MTEKQRRFVEAFMGAAAGNATKAAIMAGYSERTARSQGQRLLTKVDIQQAVAARQEDDPLVTTREERLRWWGAIMRDESQEIRHRLRASELLGRACGDFVVRHQHEGQKGQVNVYIPDNGRDYLPRLDLSALASDEIRELRRLMAKAGAGAEAASARN